MGKLTKDRGEHLEKELNKKKAPYISTGITLLDLSFGGGDDIPKGGMGIKIGDIVNIYGDTGVGKSFLFNEIIAMAKRKVETGGLKEHNINKFKWYYADIEMADNFDSENLYGFAIHPEGKRPAPKTVEDCTYHIQQMIKELSDDELLVYVVDSLDALSSRKQLEMNQEELNAFIKGKEKNKGSYDMDKAKFLAQKFFTPIADAKEGKNVVILVVSQIREKVGATMFESKTTTSNTKTLKFYFDTRMELLPVERYTTTTVLEESGESFEREIGGNVKVKPSKVRHQRPNRVIQFDFFYELGLDNVGSNVDFLYGLRDDYGKLKTNINNLSFPPKYNKEYKAANVANIKDWLKGKDIEVKSSLKKEDIMELIKENLYEEYLDFFGTGFGRQEICDYIVENDLEDELERMVIAKWEKIENGIAPPKRKRKF